MPSSAISIDDVDSGSVSSYDSDDYLAAQQEWEESINQLNQLVSFVLLPTIGKFFGRRFSYWCA